MSNREIEQPAPKVKENGNDLQYIPEELKSNEEIVLAAVACKGQALRFAAPCFRSDRKVVWMAVKQSGRALQYASDDLRGSRFLALHAVKYCHTEHDHVLEFLPAALRDDDEVVMTSVTTSGLSLEHASDRLRACKAIVLAAVKQSGLAVRFAAEDLKLDADVVREARPLTKKERKTLQKWQLQKDGQGKRSREEGNLE